MKRTSKVQLRRAGPSATATKLLGALLAVSLFLTCFASGELAELNEAARPLDEGVPQVAVMRLRNLLKSELSAADKKAVTAKLGEALLAAGDAEKALQVLQ